LQDFKEIIVPNDLAAAKEPERMILDEAKACGYRENATFAVKLALEEAVTNAFRHGNHCDPSKHITVRYKVTKKRIEIEVEDEGNGFEPSLVPDPTQPEFIDRPHGRGIMLMQAYLDEVEFSKTGNTVRLAILNRP
jgi:serine/threonine-protein kinase RsbW